MSLPLVTMPDGASVVLSAGVWASASVAIGYVAHRAPVRRFDHDTWLTRLRPAEAGGRTYERHLAIRRWKRWLPEGGAAFRGGIDKRHLPGRDQASLERFAAETRRAEVVHWALLSLSPAFVLWNRPAIAVGMVAFGVVANVPFIWVQRYNRARLERVLARRRRRVRS